MISEGREKQIVLEVVNELLETLGEVPAHKADATVRICIERLMNEVLDIPGSVKLSKMWHICRGIVPPNERTCSPSRNYKFFRD